MRHDDQHREKMFLLIDTWQNSGLSQRAYCEQQGIVYHVFHYWYKQYREQQTPPAGQPGFVPLDLQPSFVAASVELLLTDGRRLVFHQSVSADYLKALIS